MSTELDNALGLNSMPVVYDDKQSLPAVVDEQSANDVEEARDGLFDALGKSKQAVEDLVVIAQQSQHPKAYEILNQAIKTMADISMGLADLQIKKIKITGKRNDPSQDSGIVNNNLYVGTTAELLDMLEQIKGQKAD